MQMEELKEILDQRLKGLSAESFIPLDPISIPHSYNNQQDIELSAFITSLLSWGRRDMIIRAAKTLLSPMGKHPHEFLINANGKELKFAESFVYRTMNGIDASFLLKSLQNIYRQNTSLQHFFIDKSVLEGLTDLREAMLKTPHEKRSEKHIANVAKKAAGKRLNMFLRWMVRHDEKGIDFGIWNNLSAAHLILPLDVHTANSAREFKLTERKQNDLKTALEITEKLKQLDSKDPIKYDFALFLNDNPV